MKLGEFARGLFTHSADGIRGSHGDGFLILSRLKDGESATAYATLPATGTLGLRGRLSEDELVVLNPPGSASFLISIGRTTSSKVFIDHPSVSKFHAYITYDVIEQRFELKDASSRNGTQLNGRQLAPETPHILQEWDAIQLGTAAVATFHSAESLVPLLRVVS